MIHDQRITAALISLATALLLYLAPKLDATTAATIATLVVTNLVSLFTKPPGAQVVPPAIAPTKKEGD